MEIRLLTANDIETRVQSVKKTQKGVGCILLLYKNARVDQKILDETFTAFGWQRDHKELKGNIYCGIGIYDETKQQWIWKWDCGTESNTEKEKGEASDSFKRAGFNWGIGRELYTSPFIWVDLAQGEYNEKDGKAYLNSNVKFEVKSIGCNSDREIAQLQIKDNHSKVRYELGKRIETQPEPQQKPENKPADELIPKCADCSKEITTAEHDFSASKYKRPLCRTCQGKAKQAS
jgi:hypothetical protein